MRPSTTLSIIGFFNLLLGAGGFLFGLITRVIVADPTLGSNPFFRRLFDSFPLFEVLYQSPVFGGYVRWIGALSLVESLVLAVAGYGLYSTKSWARLATLGCAVYRIAASLVRFILLVGFVLTLPMHVALAVAALAVEWTYPIIVLIVLNRKVVLEGVHSVRERDATPSLRALSEKHNARSGTIPRK